MREIPAVLQCNSTELIEPVSFPHIVWDNMDTLVAQGVRHAVSQVREAEQERSRLGCNLLSRSFAGPDADPVVLERMKGVQEYQILTVMQNTLAIFHSWDVYFDGQHPAVKEEIGETKWKIFVRRQDADDGVFVLGGPVEGRSEERLSFTYLARTR